MVKEYDPNIIGWPSSMVDKADYDAIEARCRDYERALRTIVEWQDFPPATTSDGKPCSYSFAWGSNGERDHMRSVARAALTRLETPKPCAVCGFLESEHGCGAHRFTLETKDV